MSLIDMIRSREDADAVGQAMLLAQALMDGPRDMGPPTFCYTTPRVAASDEKIRSEPFGAKFGAVGVGVVSGDQHLHSAILQYSATGPATPEPLRHNKELRSAVEATIQGGFDAVADALVMRIGEPEFQAAPGDPVSAALNGTAGVQLNWGIGLDGVLTAGHVTKWSNTGASVAGISGSVVLALDPTNHGASPEADVSVIWLQSAVPAGSRITSTRTAGSGEAVTIMTRGGKTVSTTIMGQMQWLWLPKSNCTCGHVYMTTNCVTSKGDSGAPVRNKSGDLIGHVIAASVGMTSYIQLIDYQLQVIRNNASFNAATL